MYYVGKIVNPAQGEVIDKYETMNEAWLAFLSLVRTDHNGEIIAEKQRCRAIFIRDSKGTALAGWKDKELPDPTFYFYQAKNPLN